MRQTRNRQRLRGLTLMELIVVMALLAVVFAIVSPFLTSFFRGRDLDNEARRLLALTRYGRSEAISSGTALELWIDPATGDYGLQPRDPYATSAMPATQYRLADGLSFDTGQATRGDDGKLRIVFHSDGAIEGESVTVRESRGGALAIQPADAGQSYVIAEADQQAGGAR
ncbi:MAG: GspH/FimT family pseudopilin [Candidatus Sumerlaeota bacterium]|nr:GspH/FimT family pseudopilin [Candidatus Sumerlaeota bacterium]